jgi:hypothetical protein
MNPHGKQSKKSKKEQMTPHDSDERVQKPKVVKRGEIFPTGAVAGFVQTSMRMVLGEVDTPCGHSLVVKLI